MTPQDVHEAKFSRPPIGRRGYDQAEVDEFLAKAERALAGAERMTPVEIERVTFSRPLFGAGYDEREVDEFLDKLESELAARTSTYWTVIPVPRSKS
jgi:DivIVA domain-containing protein